MYKEKLIEKQSLYKRCEQEQAENIARLIFVSFNYSGLENLVPDFFPVRIRSFSRSAFQDILDNEAK